MVTETAAQGGMKGWHIAMIVFSCLLILLVVGLVIALLVKKKGGTFTFTFITLLTVAMMRFWYCTETLSFRIYLTCCELRPMYDNEACLMWSSCVGWAPTASRSDSVGRKYNYGWRSLSLCHRGRGVSGYRVPMSDKNSACWIAIRHETVSGDDVNMCMLP